MGKLFALFLIPLQVFANPILYEDLSAERYTDMPASAGVVPYNDPLFNSDRCIRYIEMPRPTLGEIWDVSAEVHVTNDDLRSRGFGLYVTTEVIVGDTTGNSRLVDGLLPLQIIKPSGAYNVGPEAHHGLIPRRGIIKWTQADLNYISQYETIYLKYMVWSGSTQYQSGDRCEITPGRGQLKVLVWEP